MAVAADAISAARAAVRKERKDAVAEVRFGARAKAGDRAARGEADDLARCEMRRMHDAPAAVDRAVLEQPFHRPLAERQRAFLDFARLLRGVDMDRRALVDAGEELLQRLGIDRPQRMRRHAGPDVRAQAAL